MNNIYLHHHLQPLSSNRRAHKSFSTDSNESMTLTSNGATYLTYNSKAKRQTNKQTNKLISRMIRIQFWHVLFNLFTRNPFFPPHHMTRKQKSANKKLSKAKKQKFLLEVVDVIVVEGYVLEFISLLSEGLIHVQYILYRLLFTFLYAF